jgi:hypothetical protein
VPRTGAGRHHASSQKGPPPYTNRLSAVTLLSARQIRHCPSCFEAAHLFSCSAHGQVLADRLGPGDIGAQLLSRPAMQLPRPGLLRLSRM